ncbi:MAG: hypothetical protein AAFY60_00425 [Myxococcota bacterium]
MSKHELKPESPVLQDSAALKAEIDALYDATPPIQRHLGGRLVPAWLTDELLSHMDGSMHLMSQHLINHEVERFDGPGLLAAFGSAVAAFDLEACRYCQWVAQRAQRHARADENESFVSVTNAVGRVLWPQMRDACVALLERMPQDYSLEPHKPMERQVFLAAPATPYYPNVRLDPTTQPEASQLIDRTVTALWKAGADDDALERCEQTLRESGPSLLEAIEDWLVFKPALSDREAVRASLFPPDPLEQFLGFEPTGGLVQIDEARFEEACGALRPHGYLPCCGEQMKLRVAVRSDPAGIILKAVDCTDTDSQLVSQLLEMGYLILCCGEGSKFVPS